MGSFGLFFHVPFMSPTKHALQMGCQNSRTVMILTLNIPPISEMMYKKFELIRLTSTSKKTDPKQKITHVIFIVFSLIFASCVNMLVKNVLNDPEVYIFFYRLVQWS